MAYKQPRQKMLCAFKYTVLYISYRPLTKFDNYLNKERERVIEICVWDIHIRGGN